MKWLHKLLHPHCEHCKEEKTADRECRSCEILQLELERVYREKELLLSKLLIKDEPRAPVKEEETEFKPFAPSGGRRFIPSAVRQQMIDNEDNATLQLMQKRKREISELENAVLSPIVDPRNSEEPGDRNAS